MKISWRWLVGAVLLLVGLAAAAVPVISGIQAERVFKEQVALMDASLNAELGPGARAAVSTYDRGLYRTDTQTRIELPAELLPRSWRRSMELPDGPVVFMLDQQLRHGLGRINFDGYLRPEGVTEALLNRLGGGAESIRLQGAMGVGEQSVTLETDRLSGLIDPLQAITLTLEPLVFVATYRDADAALTTDLDWPGAVIRSEREEAELRAEGIQSAMTGRLVAGSLFDGVWVGDSELTVDSLSARQPGVQPASVSDVKLLGRSGVDEREKLTGEVELTWQDLSLPDVPTTRGELGVRVAGFDPEAMLAFSRLAQTMNEADIESFAGQAAIADLLADGATLSMPVLRVESVAGQGFGGSANLLVQPQFADQLRAGVTGMPLLRSIEMEAEGGIDAALIDVLPAEQQLWARQLEGFGLLRREDDQLRARMNLSGGVLSVNGLTWWDISR